MIFVLFTTTQKKILHRTTFRRDRKLQESEQISDQSHCAMYVLSYL